MEKKVTAIIELEEMDFFAFHGCYPEEQKNGSKFVVNIKVETDISLPAKTDNIDDALNYVKIYELVKKEMEQRSNLLEHVVTRIINKLSEQFPQIIGAEVKISKIDPPIGGKMRAVSLRVIENKQKKNN